MELGNILDSTPEPSPALALKHMHGAGGNTSGDYCLPIGMTDFQKQLTDQVVSLHYSEILKFFCLEDGLSPDQVTLTSLQTLATNAQLCATHPFLLIDHYMPHNMLLKEVPERLARSSQKFRVLGILVDLISRPLSIALVARGGKTIDLIEAFLIGRQCNYRRVSGTYLKDPGANLDPELPTIHLIPTDLDIKYMPHPGAQFDLVLAFDSYFDENAHHIQFIRRGGVVPVIRLVPFNSVEHVEYYFRNTKNQPSYLRNVIAGTVVLRDRVGGLPNDLQHVFNHNLEILREWLNDLGVKLAPWPIVDLPAIPEYETSDVEKALMTEVKPTGDDTGTNGNGTETDFYHARKHRKHEMVEVHEETKDVYIYSNAEGHQLTHAMMQRLESVEFERQQLKSEVDSHRKLAARNVLAHEKVIEDNGELVRENAKLTTRIKAAEKRSERAAQDTQRSREAQEKLTAELQQVKELLGGSAPEKAELQSLRDELASVKQELERSKERFNSKESECEFTRAEYQKASAAAMEAIAEKKELESALQKANQKVEANAIQLRQLTFDEERKAFQHTIKELQTKIEFFDSQVKRMAEADKNSGGRRAPGLRGVPMPRYTKSPV